MPATRFLFKRIEDMHGMFECDELVQVQVPSGNYDRVFIARYKYKNNGIYWTSLWHAKETGLKIV